MYKYKMAYISGIVHFSLLGERLFSRSRPRGTQGARVPTRLQFDLGRRSVPQALVAQSRAALTMSGDGCRAIKANQGFGNQNLRIF